MTGAMGVSPSTSLGGRVGKPTMLLHPDPRPARRARPKPSHSRKVAAGLIPQNRGQSP